MSEDWRARERTVEARSLEEETARLLERHRRGELDRESLHFARYLGCEASGLVLGALAGELEGQPPGYRPPPVDAHVEWWVHAMPGFWVLDFPRLVAISQRVAAALTRVAASHLPEHRRAQEACEAMERWVLEGDEASQTRGVTLGEELVAEVARAGFLAGFTRRRELNLLRALDLALWPMRIPDLHVNSNPSLAGRLLAEALGERAVREGLRRELLPWALGSFDPIRARLG